MPSATSYQATPGTAEYKKQEAAWNKESLARRTADSKLWAYYDGEMQKALKPDGSKVDDNVIVNLIELEIEKGISSLMGSDEVGLVEGVKFQVVVPEVETDDELEEAVDAGPSREELAQDWLDKAWAANKKGILLHDIASNGGICGHAFAKIVPQEANVAPRLINLNPSCIGAFWAEDDVDKVLWYRIEYATTRQDIVRVSADGQPDRWEIYNFIRKTPSDGLVGRVEQAFDTNPWKAEGESTVWPYAWPPVVDWKNLPRPNNYYGKNDIGQNWRLNDAFNILISYAMRVLKMFTDPRVIGTGFTVNDLTSSKDIKNFWAIGNSEAKVFTVEMQSDLSALQNIAQIIRRAFFDTTREIDSGTVQDKLGDMTNFDLRVLFRDSIAKLTTKRLTYGDGLKRICERLLELGGFTGMEINIVWPDPLPNDPLAQASALEKDVTVGGISQRTYQERRGYDPDAEDKAKEKERADKVHDQMVVSQGQQASQLETLGRLMIGRQAAPPTPAANAKATYG